MSEKLKEPKKPTQPTGFQIAVLEQEVNTCNEEVTFMSNDRHLILQGQMDDRVFCDQKYWKIYVLHLLQNKIKNMMTWLKILLV